ncbi:Mitogen-activated protein kinase pmk-3 [Caenorhabditis elegans]|uniref:Mitogen-activated protein kinase pmk-3 n=2 Tax=Caenorhabditis elegans TaxID=6239 RepID=PMK3_CAEEL|nr:Mitogen-activated protein kinase pmk-3 [Caenorhabditis elegans]O44514.2 RecName: Full=Mitogen-activated protein kinase pmk-3; AltName: Full=Stress-activated protein kinase pmk-3; AltName: Full=p38 MAP kinase 3 [Caenorhabditis elegans]CCD61404.1 Mitogen-activated protein kinase pmk-3 [Caenorhabditis elegans]|eukprot:NP_501363.1 Mitogen-activated protein kinase pmk-3 [Caenorhabditis elegans]
MASVPSSSSLPVSHVRRHEDVSTPSAPPTKRSNNQSQPPESYEPNTWLQQQREQEQQKKLAAENIKKQSIEATGNNEMVGEEEEDILSKPCGPHKRRFQFVMIRNITFAIPEGYDVEPNSIEYLGGGSFGNVIKTSAVCRDGLRRYVAIKKMREPFFDPHHARRIFRETKLLQLMRHDNIICALDIYTPDEENDFRDVYVVTEFAGRSLYQILKQQRDYGRRVLTDEHIKFIIYQIIRALKYIHSANIIHRDLKPGNLALTDDSDLMILDFGLARSLEKKDTSLTQYVQTRWYRSPEVIYWKIDSYTNLADMWSLGCIAAELLTGEPLFPGDEPNAQYQRITQLCGSPDEELLTKIENDNSSAIKAVIQSYTTHKRRNFRDVFSAHNPSEDFIDLLEKLLVLDPEKRITVEEAIQHPYLAEFSLPEDEPRADHIFDLDDSQARTRFEWRDAVWKEIMNYKRLSSSPLIPGEADR